MLDKDTCAVLQAADRLIPLDEAWRRLNALGMGHFAIDELIRAARRNRARQASSN